MSLYYPDLPVANDEVVACHLAIEHGRQLVLDDLRAHPTQSAETYALAAASYVYATLMPNARKHLLVKMADNLTLTGSSNLTPADFANHKEELDKLQAGLGIGQSVWACGMQDIAVGIAQAADELFQADGDGRGYPGSSAREFVFQFVYAMPEHKHIGGTTPVTRPVDAPTEGARQPVVTKADSDTVEAMAPVVLPVNPRGPIAAPAIAAETVVTTAGLIDQWLDAKGGLSRAERSRQGSSARLFVEAVGLTGTTADRLAEIGENAADQFVQNATGSALAVRGQRARILHIKSFIAYAQSMHIAVPDQDWTHVHN